LERIRELEDQPARGDLQSEPDKLNLYDYAVGTLQSQAESALVDLLLREFPNPELLSAFLPEAYGRWVSSLPRETDYKNRLENLITRLTSEGIIDEFVEETFRKRTVSIGLQRVVDAYDLWKTATTAGAWLHQVAGTLETTQTHENITAGDWIARMLLAKGATARIKVPFRRTSKCGTGVLVGERLLLTAYNLIEHLVNEQDTKTSTKCRVNFGYMGINGSDELKFADDWLVAGSPTNKQDWALVKLASADSNQVSSRGPIPIRGLDQKIYACIKSEPMLIMINTLGGPFRLLSVPLADNNAEDWLVHAKSVLPGSSGSPCFSAAWQMVGLHRGTTRSRGLAVRVSRIIADLKGSDLVTLQLMDNGLLEIKYKD
jgi:hypothetical protein